jgi:predicted RNA-binding protein with PIN domain
VGYGAEWMSAQQLAFEVETAARRIQRKQRSTQRSPQRFLANSLDPAAQQRLAELRMGIKPKKFKKF